LGGVALALAALTRPEGLLIAAVLVVVLAIRHRRTVRNSIGSLAALLLSFLAIVVPYQLWRLAFYGYPFPNTFYLKTGATLAIVERGLEYLVRFAADHWLVVLLPILWLLSVAGVLLAGKRVRAPVRPSLRGDTDLVWALATVVTAYSLYILVVGGDHFPGYRFFVPIIAPLALLAQAAASAGTAYLRQRGLPSGFAVAPVLALAVAYFAWSAWLERPGTGIAKHIREEIEVVDQGGSEGLWLRDHTPPGAWTADSAAGAIAYYGQRRVIDILGLNDLHIAHLPDPDIGKAGHEQSDPQYVMSRRPDYLPVDTLWTLTPVLDQVDRDYVQFDVACPTGIKCDWLRRRDAPLPSP
jgi:hypothetical protein